MTIKARADAFERRMRAVAAAMQKSRRLPVALVFINDPEEGLDEYRLPADVLARNETIEIGGPQFAEPRAGDAGK